MGSYTHINVREYNSYMAEDSFSNVQYVQYVQSVILLFTLTAGAHRKLLAGR